jgi:peptide/nickel transport system substrate-binding protein
MNRKKSQKRLNIILWGAIVCLVITGGMYEPLMAAPLKELVLAIGGENAEGYDPTLGWGRYGNPLFQSTLLRRDEQMNIVNDLATEYSLSPDRMIWKITLREDVRFSDGELLTAEDVVYTFNMAAQSGGKVDLTMFEEAVVTGEYSLELRLKKPWITFANYLITLGIVPKHAHGEEYGRNPIGSGPYKLVHWAEGQQMVVEANPLYYGEQPQIKRLVFLFIDEDTSFAAAKAGKVHVVAVPQTLAIQDIPEMHVHLVKSVDNRGLMFPVIPDEGTKTADGDPIGNNVTADPAIRKAVNYAIDRKALVEGVLEGFGTPAYSLVDGLPWEQPDARFEDGNLDKARQILADAGWKDTDGDGILEKNGLKAEFSLIYSASDSTRQNLALASADMLKKIGIKADVQGKSWDDIEKLMHSCVIVFGWGSHDPTEMYNLYHSTMTGAGWYNTGYYSNPIVDKYLEQAMGAPSFEASLPYWKAAQWDGKTGFTTPGDAAWAWLVNLTHTYFVSDCLDVGQSQIEPHGHGWPITANIVKWKWICE